MQTDKVAHALHELFCQSALPFSIFRKFEQS
jgi:hypothetical protein